MRRINLTKRALSFLIALVMIAGMVAVVPVSAAQTVQSVEVDDVSVLRYTEGSWYKTTIGGDPTVYNWYKYDTAARNVKVTFAGGDTYEGPVEGLSDFGVTYSYRNDKQDYNSEWGVGAHTITLVCGGVNAEYDFIITDSEVSSIEFDPVSFMLGTHGWRYTSDGVEWWKYDSSPDRMKITMSDGTVYEGTDYMIESQSGFEFHLLDDQDVNSQWGVGLHDVRMIFAGYVIDYEVEVTESPVASVTATDITAVEGSNGYNSTETWWDGDELKTATIYRYRLESPSYTVTMKNGTVYTGAKSDIEDQIGAQILINDPQAHDYVFTAGNTYDITVSVLGTYGHYKFTLTESPVKSITAESAEIIEGTTGSTWNHMSEWWFHYNMSQLENKFTVTMNDGTVYEGTADEVESAVGAEILFTDDQSFSNQWSVGDHEVTVSCMGKTGTFTVTITESPVESFTVDPITIVEGTHGYWSPDYISGGVVDRYYYSYYTSAERVTVKMKNGTTISGTPGEIRDKTGYSVEYLDFVIGEAEWTPGKYYAMATFMGVTDEYSITITENNIASVKAEDTPVTIPAYTGGYYDEDWVYSWENDRKVTFYRYEPKAEKVTVTEKSGATFTGTPEEVREKYGESVSFLDTQGATNVWKPGTTNTAQVAFMGRMADYDVTIAENPVKSVTAEDAKVTEYTDGRYDGRFDNASGKYLDHSWYRYSLLPSKVTVEFKDGTTFTGTPAELEEKYGSEFIADDNQYASSPYGVGVYDVTGQFMGVEASYKYEIVKGSDTPVTVTGVDFRDVDVEEDQRSFSDAGTTIWLYYPDFTVHFSDGTSAKSQDGGAGVNRKFVRATYDDGQLKTPWTAGSSHKVKISFEGFEGEFTVNIKGESPAFIPGDVDGNNKLNAKDVTAIMKFLVGAKPKKFNEAAADFDGNGKTNAKDVTKLMKHLVTA